MSDTENDSDELALDSIFPVSTVLLRECILPWRSSHLTTSSFCINYVKEPPRPPSPEPTFVTYFRDRPEVSASEEIQNIDHGLEESWEKIDLKLVGSHSLWGHYLWVFLRMIQLNMYRLTNQYVL